MISDNPRNHLLFVLGINNGLQTGELLKLHVQQMAGMKPGDSIKEGRTGKQNILVVNKTVHKRGIYGSQN